MAYIVGTLIACSGFGTCAVSDPKNIVCSCESGYQYVPPGRCILEALVDDSSGICSGHGYVVVSDGGAPAMSCKCSSIYTGTKCETCNTATAQQIGSDCVSRDCILPPAEPSDPGDSGDSTGGDSGGDASDSNDEDPSSPAARRAPRPPRETSPVVCGDNAEYTVFGDASNPFITCIPTGSNAGKVVAYNSTLFVDPGCVYVSRIDRTRRFYCGFLKGLTDDLPEGTPSPGDPDPSDSEPDPAVPDDPGTDPAKLYAPVCSNDKGSTAITCTQCPTDFYIVHLADPTNPHDTCMHKNCFHGEDKNPSVLADMWYNFCGGVGDCIKFPNNTYGCDCGPNAVWNDTLKACINETCKLNSSYFGPDMKVGNFEYCSHLSDEAFLGCMITDSYEWECNCTKVLGSSPYVNYNKTCVPRDAIAMGIGTAPAKGFCGGPGAGYLDDKGQCQCSGGFRKIGDFCYSLNCLPVGIEKFPQYLSVNRVCSGQGICTYNQLTGTYGCECSSGEAFGGYCTNVGCVAKIIYNNTLRYVQCNVYDGGTQLCKESGGSYSCNCGTSERYMKVDGLNICAHRGCVQTVDGKNIYCGEDLLASCQKGADHTYRCVCSEGHESHKSLTHVCIPSVCIYKDEHNANITACNNLGNCTGTLLQTKQCTCNEGIKSVTVIDINGERRQTCMPETCISETDSNGISTICGISGVCIRATGKCACYHTTLLGNICTVPKCLVNTTDEDATSRNRICGGPTIGACVPKGETNDLSNYECQCVKAADPVAPAEEADGDTATFENVEGLCLPAQCVFAVTTDPADAQSSVKTMCGGSRLGYCSINVASPKESTCVCDSRYGNITQVASSGKCISTSCVSAPLSPEEATEATVEECYGHGSCQGSWEAGYNCTCEAGYTSVQVGGKRYECIPAACVGESSTICSGRGTCSFAAASAGPLSDAQATGSCACDAGYTGATCSECAEGYGKGSDGACYPNDCPADGECNSDSTGPAKCELTSGRFQCNCNDQFSVVDKDSKKCRKSKCVWVDPYTSKETLCNNLGTCTDTETCSCNTGVTLRGASLCVYESCLSGGTRDSESDTVCKKIGVCVQVPGEDRDRCQCDAGQYCTDAGSGQCFPRACFGNPGSGLADVCDGGGTCDEAQKTCSCTAPDFVKLPGVGGCVHKSCLSADSEVCGGHGVCAKTGDAHGCACDSGYAPVGPRCIPAQCLNGTLICNGGGTCVGTGSLATCSCSEGWSLVATLCYPSGCVARGSVCSGNGDCELVTGSSCACHSGYSSALDALCISTRCIAEDKAGTMVICGGHGTCESAHGAAPACVCEDGYALLEPFRCGKSGGSSVTVAAVVALVVLGLAGLAGFLVWRFVVRPRRRSNLRRFDTRLSSFGNTPARTGQYPDNDATASNVPLLGSVHQQGFS